jgi:hypothetical protein
MFAVRKLKIVPDEEDKQLRNNVYKFIRDAQYNQYLCNPHHITTTIIIIYLFFF